ncbi:MAG: hypothetical protein K1X57_12590 [Gemmataceae bacterium]|nr:hypothetical protein [Gemmataceae bacterium]
MRKLFLFGSLIALGLAVGAARAWWVIGHETITEAAALILPDDVPAFYRAAGKSLAHCAGDPDRWKNKEAVFLKSTIAPEHFLDMEDLDGNEPPRNRFVAYALLNKLNRDPEKVGSLPWAIMEGYEKLMCAFYDYRQEPGNPAVAMKAVVYGGNLAHYTTDACMPLHTTRDYDGRKGPDGKMKQKGIHAKVDAFPELNKFAPEEVCRGLQAKAIEGDVFDHVIKFIKESHTHIDECYRLDAAGAIANPTDASRKFIMARCRAGAQLTVDIWYTAWLRSEKLPKHY